MKRREFVEKLGIGSAGLVSGAVLAGNSSTPARADQGGQHDHRPVSGALANATVSFGQWKTVPPLDRYPNVSSAAANGHLLIPHRATIKAGGSVNFIIAGLHQVAVYAPGTKPEDIDKTITRPTTGVPPGVPLINDANNRVYAGLDPSTQPRDRVEVVHFPNRGLHLVICAVLPHFLDNMWGYVRVQSPDEDDE